MTALQVFTNALEKTLNTTFVSSVTYTPLRIPAYKEFVFSLKEVPSEGKHRVYKMSYKAQASTQKEREDYVEKLTEEFIAYVLTELLNNKEHETI